jgi:20S proteasome subunit beta 2
MFWKRGLSNEVGNLGRSIPYVTSNNEENVPLAPLPAILHCLRTQLQKSRGQLGVNLLVGGYDPVSQRATLAAIHPHGSMDIITYGALGSGGLAATGILESRYPKIESGQCTLEEGIHLAVDAVRAGVENDLGSGSQVDVCIITKEGVLYRRAVVEEETLEWFDKNKDINDVSRMQMTNNVGGVNGFGNIPFAIQSEKVVVSAELHSTQAKRQWLDNILRTDEQENK